MNLNLNSLDAIRFYTTNYCVYKALPKQQRLIEVLLEVYPALKLPHNLASFGLGLYDYNLHSQLLTSAASLGLIKTVLYARLYLDSVPAPTFKTKKLEAKSRSRFKALEELTDSYTQVQLVDFIDFVRDELLKPLSIKGFVAPRVPRIFNAVESTALVEGSQEKLYRSIDGRDLSVAELILARWEPPKG